MKQITRIETNQMPPQYGYALNNKTVGAINYLLLGLRCAMKSIVREAVNEALNERESNIIEDDRTLNARELCERWNISANTLRNWEIDGKIAPLPLKGRKKIYSMKDVLAAEAEGYIKKVA